VAENEGLPSATVCRPHVESNIIVVGEIVSILAVVTMRRDA